MILVKNLHFLDGLFSFDKIDQEIMFGDVLKRKQAFLGNKNINFIW